MSMGSRCEIRKKGFLSSNSLPILSPSSPSALSLSSCIRQLEPLSSATWLLRPTYFHLHRRNSKRGSASEGSSRSASSPAQRSPAGPSSLVRPTLSFRGLGPPVGNALFPPARTHTHTHTPTPPIARDRRLALENTTAPPSRGGPRTPERIPTVTQVEGRPNIAAPSRPAYGALTASCPSLIRPG